MRFFWSPVLLGALALTACPPPGPGPAPVAPPDASDASATADAAPVPMTPCQSACDALRRICAPQADDCVTVMAHIDGARLIRTPSGAPLTCAAISAATSKPAMRALGVDCP